VEGGWLSLYTTHIDVFGRDFAKLFESLPKMLAYLIQVL
jgi:hypothetical protein